MRQAVATPQPGVGVPGRRDPDADGPFTAGRMASKITAGPTPLMSNPGRPDSAIALARSPLFSHLGRLDLARLAGELEERHFKPGEVIVRQGDRPDGFYVIKQGRAAVVASGAIPAGGGDAAGERLTTLGPGEVLGRWRSSRIHRAPRRSWPRPTSPCGDSPDPASKRCSTTSAASPGASSAR